MESCIRNAVLAESIVVFSDYIDFTSPNERQPRFDYRYAPGATGAWHAGTRPYFQYRDVGLSCASGGAIGGWHLRRHGMESAVSGWHHHSADYQFFYVLAGEVTIELEDGTRNALHQGCVGWQPGGLRHNEYGFSPDYSVLDLTSPAAAGTVAEPVPGQDRPASSEAWYAFGEELGPFREDAVWAGLVGRELVTRHITGGRIAIREVRAGAAFVARGDRWRRELHSRFVFVLSGNAEFDFGRRGKQVLGRYDALCVSEGIDVRRIAVSDDYAHIEIFPLAGRW